MPHPIPTIVAAFIAAAVVPAAVPLLAQTNTNLLEGPAAYGDWHADSPGTRRLIRPQDLPAPDPAESVRNTVTNVRRTDAQKPIVPNGFEVNAGEARPTDIARRLGVSHATAVKAISRLKRAGLATARPYRGVFLTEKGRALADRVRVRHRLVVDLLCALGVPTESAEADAEGIERHVSEITLKAFAQFLKSRG
jgi:DtxR family manganese transport transcriptional regulator